MNIQVYTKPGCVQCEYTEKKLSEWHVPHNTVDVTQDPAAMQQVLASGNMQMPMVVAGDDHWNGFQYDKLQDLKAIAGLAYGLGLPQDLPNVSSCPPQEGYL
jgi:glutaredoxin-like protein NrdH